ncbi:MAG: ribonuclease P [Candidatus Aenigmatarchaeota archaeon]
MKNRNRGTKPKEQVKIAEERIDILFSEAEKIVKSDKKLADRYVNLARKIGMRYNVRMPRMMKRKYCRYCHAFLQPGLTSKHSLKKGILRIKCFSCNRTIRYPIK